MPQPSHIPRARVNHHQPEGRLPTFWGIGKHHASPPFHSVPFASWVESWEWWTDMLSRARLYTIGLGVHERLLRRKLDRRKRWKQLHLSPA